MERIECAGYSELVFPGKRDCIVLAVLGGEEAEKVWELLKEPRPVLVTVSGVDWNRELSPWPAPAVFRNGGDFAGEGAVFLEKLTGELLPKVKKTLEVIPSCCALAGYSLAGLFALWAACKTSVFQEVASVSGSLWYDGFLDFLETNPPKNLRRAYLSLGDKEKNVKNQRMAKIENNTVRTAQFLEDQGIPTMLEYNPGGHFREPEKRLARGIDALQEC